MDAQTRFWVIVLGGVLVAWLTGELLSLVLWTWMRDRAMLAARIGWTTAIVAAMLGVDQVLGLFSRPPVLVGEGFTVLVMLIVFAISYRRRPV